jgi:hypothetical protein
VITHGSLVEQRERKLRKKLRFLRILGIQALEHGRGAVAQYGHYLICTWRLESWCLALSTGLWRHSFAHANHHMGGCIVCLAKMAFVLTLDRTELLIRLLHTALAMGEQPVARLIGSCQRAQGRCPTHARILKGKGRSLFQRITALDFI